MHWTSLANSAAKGTLSSEVGRLSLFAFLEERKILPGNIVSNMIASEPKLNGLLRAESLPQIRKQMDQIALTLRLMATHAESTALFDIVANVGEHYAWCESAHDPDGGTRVPFLMRKEIFHAILNFDKELEACHASAKAPTSDTKATARAFELLALKEMGLQKLSRTETELLQPLWKHLSAEAQEKLAKSFESQARYEGQKAIADSFAEPSGIGSSKYQSALQKVENYYLSDEQLIAGLKVDSNARQLLINA